VEIIPGTEGMTAGEREAYLASLERHDEREAQFQVNYGDKDDYVGVPFDIVRIELRPGGNPQGEDDWAVTVIDKALPEGEQEVVFTFDKNRARDGMMANFQDLIKRFHRVPSHTLQDLPAKPGQSNPYTIVPMTRYRDLSDIEADRLQRARDKKKRRGGK
jgi:hypothetical protein